MKVQFGIDVLLANPQPYPQARTGLVCNQASVAQNGINTRLALQQAGFNLIKIFGPEHGFDTTGEDGKFIHHQIDQLTQLPIISLYSEKLAPSREDLADLDLVIVDLPDIGSRFYTYLWTMSYVMESCEKYHTPILILDRPNPIASHLEMAEGPLLTPACSSFIGRFPIPINHQCTFGELAQYFKTMYYPQLNLEVLPMQHWDRTTNTNYHFHATSPAIQNREVTYIYPGSCLFEGLNINEGRGTDQAFQQFGAPWINHHLLAKTAEQQLTTATIEKVAYTPSFGLYENEECYGLKITPIQPTQFKAVAYFIKLIQIIHQLFPDELQERNYLTNVNPDGSKHLDKLLGVPHAFQKIIEGQITTTVPQWAVEMQPHLLYKD